MCSGLLSCTQAETRITLLGQIGKKQVAPFCMPCRDTCRSICRNHITGSFRFFRVGQRSRNTRAHAGESLGTRLGSFSGAEVVAFQATGCCVLNGGTAMVYGQCEVAFLLSSLM